MICWMMSITIAVSWEVSNVGCYPTEEACLKMVPIFVREAPEMIGNQEYLLACVKSQTSTQVGRS